jgi:hypothetical protein
VAGEVQLNRRRLVRMLVRETSAEPGAIEALAEEASWPLPRTVAVLALGGEVRAGVAAHLPAEVICETVGDLGCAIVPDPDAPGRRAMIERAVAQAGAGAGLGTTVGWDEAAVSFARAVAALELAHGSAGLVVARERAGELLLRSDQGLATELAADRLAPLGTLSSGARERLTETLAAWLSEQGRVGQVAERLDIHPQTARYRLSRLRELFGDALEDPDERFWLEVALRARAG